MALSQTVLSGMKNMRKMSQIAKKPHLFDFGVGETGGEVELVLAGYFVDGGLVLGHFDLLPNPSF